MFFKKSVTKILAHSDPWDVFVDLLDRLGTKRKYSEFSPAEKLLWCVYLLRAESENGTLDAYASNSSGDLYDDTVTFLRVLNASEAVEILVEFNSLISGKMSGNRAERNAALEKAYAGGRKKVEGKVRELTDRLSEMWPDLISKTVEYLRAHAEQLK